MKIRGFKTKKAAVEAGLRVLVDIHGQTGIRELRGKIAWEGDLLKSRATRFPNWPKQEK